MLYQNQRTGITLSAVQLWDCLITLWCIFSQRSWQAVWLFMGSEIYWRRNVGSRTRQKDMPTIDAVGIWFFCGDLHWPQKEQCGGERDHTSPCSGLTSSTVLMKVILTLHWNSMSLIWGRGQPLCTFNLPPSVSSTWSGWTACSSSRGGGCVLFRHSWCCCPSGLLCCSPP